MHPALTSYNYTTPMRQDACNGFIKDNLIWTSISSTKILSWQEGNDEIEIDSY